ncbi:MAG: hypothetical protein PHR56_01300 [Dehalococcoidales bacterium]|nr:hypothetical protein [Dehalococcoidales bacterium]
MDIFPKGELKMLLEAQTVGCICVSMYLPTYKGGTDQTQQNPVRLRNLLKDAHARLMKAGLRAPEATKFLEPVQGILTDSFFWRHQGDGLVVFLADDFFRYYRLPVQFKEAVVVSKRFHVKPLLTMLSADGLFYILAISQKTVRLYQCTHYGFREIDLDGIIPRSLAEAMKYEHFDRELQFHHHSGLPGREPVLAHGKEPEDRKDELLKYSHMVDRGLRRDILENENAPLVLAGVDYFFPIYKEANTYANLFGEAVEGNPDRLTPEEIHAKAWAIIEPHFKREEEEAARQYRKLAGTGKTAEDLSRIVTDSYSGKVYRLLIAAGAERWGTFDPYTNVVSLHAKEESCDEDLLDMAAAHTLAHRGTVHVVAPENMPDGTPAAAVLRYATAEIPQESNVGGARGTN